MGIFVILISSGAGFVLPSLQMNRLSGNVTDATLYAQEGIEAVRSIRNQGWNAPFLGTICSGGCGISTGSGFWAWNGGNNTKPPYTRVITVLDVLRDGVGNVVASGGVNDPNTKKVTSTVSWSFTATRPQTVSLVTYMTNWRKAIGGNWANTTLEACLDLPGAADGKGVATAGSYAYVLRNNTSSNFTVVDISTPTVPTAVATISLSGTPSGIALSGNYAFVTTNNTSGELVVVDITNPLVPTVATTLNIPGNLAANALYISGTYAYVVRVSGTNNFTVVNIGTPTTPVVTGSMTLSSDGSDVMILGTYAYVASGDNNRELQVVNVTTPSAPILTGSLNLSGNTNGVSITAFGTTVLVGRNDGSVALINVTTPSVPTLITTYLSGVGADSHMIMDPSNTYAFMATNVSTKEFQSVLVATPSTPSLSSFVNLGNNLTGVAYSSTKDRVMVTGINNTQEVCVIRPN